MILKMLKGKIFSFIFFRYLGYGFQLINSILIAKYIGVYYFGIYGFITLIIQYANYSNFGIPYSLNVLLSQNLEKIGDKEKRILGTSIFSLIGVTIIILIVGFYFSNVSIPLLDKYDFYIYIYWVLGLVIVEMWCQLFVNLHRTYNRLKYISLYQVLPHLLILLCCIFFKNTENLLILVLKAQFFGLILSLGTFILKRPLSPLWGVTIAEMFKLFNKGIGLLVYNFVFSLILISTRTMIGIFYTVDEMGQYSLINSMSSAIGMLLGAISFVFFPSMINKLKSSVPLPEASSFINRVNFWYFFCSSFIVYLAICFIPLIKIILPEFEDSIIPFSFLLLVQLVLGYLFGHPVFLIARNKENILTVFAALAIFINIIIVLVMAYFDVSFKYVPISTIVSVGIYVFLVRYYSDKILKASQQGVILTIRSFPLPKLLLPLIIICVLNFIRDGYMYYWIAFIVFTLLSIRDLRKGYVELLRMVKNNFI